MVSDLRFDIEISPFDGFHQIRLYFVVDLGTQKLELIALPSVLPEATSSMEMSASRYLLSSPENNFHGIRQRYSCQHFRYAQSMLLCAEVPPFIA